MKKITILCCILGLFTSVFAQPVINYNSSHAIGTQSNLYYIDGTTEALLQSGENVTWDLSSNMCAVLGTYDVVDPSTTPYASSYPSATSAFMLDQGVYGISYVYEIDDPTEANLVAEDIGGYNPIIYTNNKKTMQYPFSYTNSYVDEFQTTTGSPIMETSTYDAYGTLIINGKTYNDVVRISRSTGDYAFLITTPAAFPIIFTSGGLFFYNDISTFSSINNLSINAEISIYPNPVSDILNVQLLNCEFSQEVKLTIVNYIGQTIKQIQISNVDTSVKLDNFASGIYFYQLQDNTTILKTGKFIIE